jgi:poly(ADP-ribose) glycohydrolase ARH3
MRWTDDTQMSIDIVESFLANGEINPDDLAKRFAESYRWSRGYGPGTARLLKRIAAGADWRAANRSVYPDGSFGNGAAMRAPMIGLIYANRPTELLEAAKTSAVVTHAHPLAIDGAILTARATACALHGDDSHEILRQEMARVTEDKFASRLALAHGWLKSSRDIPAKQVAAQLGNGIAAHESCVTALYLALRFRARSFLEMQQFITTCGGDTDTIGAMAGAIWGTANGSANLPLQSLERLEQRDRLLALAASLHQKIGERALDGI